MSAHGCAGNAQAGGEGTDRMSATGTPNPSLSVRYYGEMTERPKVYDWKSYVPERVPRVQIPLSPIVYLKVIKLNTNK